jgi:hypothetical protein
LVLPEVAVLPKEDDAWTNGSGAGGRVLVEADYRWVGNTVEVSEAEEA